MYLTKNIKKIKKKLIKKRKKTKQQAISRKIAYAKIKIAKQ